MSSRKLVVPALLSVALFALAACGMDAPSPPPTLPPPPPTASQAAVLEDQLQALDQARAVEETLQQGQDRTDAALDIVESP